MQWRSVIPSADTEVLHGYTLGDLQVLAKKAVNTAFYRAMDYPDRLEAAWFAIVEQLYDPDGDPNPWALIRTGRTAVDNLVRDDWHHHGRSPHNPYAGDEAMPHFQRYWWTQRFRTSSCENHVVDRVALYQIWPQLSATHQQVLMALAVHGDYGRAAASIGKTYGTYTVHVKNARKAFLKHWHEGEIPSRCWGTDRRVARRGDELAQRPSLTRAVTRRETPAALRPVKEFSHGASAYINHGCRCEVCTAAATEKARERRRKAGTKQRRQLTADELATISRLRGEGLSQRAIADEIGVSGTTILRVLRGGR